MKKELICIVCPMGCRMQVEMTGDNLSVTGNTCRRGEEYAVAECTAPTRTVTSTLRLDDGRSVAVKTAAPIPKEKIFELMAIIRAAKAKAPICMGQVLIPNVFGTDIVATAAVD